MDCYVCQSFGLKCQTVAVLAALYNSNSTQNLCINPPKDLKCWLEHEASGMGLEQWLHADCDLGRGAMKWRELGAGAFIFKYKVSRMPQVTAVN